MDILYILAFCIITLIKYTLSRNCEKEANTLLINFKTNNAVYQDMLKTPTKSKKVKLAEGMIAYFKTCISQTYPFQVSHNKKAFITVPNLEEYLNMRPGTRYFNHVASVAEIFFKIWRSWNELKDTYIIKTAEGKVISCEDMLWIFSARYIYYIYVLKIQETNGIKVSLCNEVLEDNHMIYVLPDSVCYPQWIGSLTCTADVNIALTGPDAGKLVGLFQSYFIKTYPEGCPSGDTGEMELIMHCSSDVLLSNNMYSYSLEFAVPELFKSSITSSDKALEQEDASFRQVMKNSEVLFLISDIIYATLPVLRSYEPYYHVYKELIQTNYQPIYDQLKVENKLASSVEILFKDAEKNSMTSNQNRGMYSKLMSSIVKHYAYSSMRRSQPTLVFAPGVYHSTGALRVVVVGIQMQRSLVKRKITIYNYWASMMENWGMALTKLLKCAKTVIQCLRHSSKYLWRFFVSMKYFRESSEQLNINYPAALKNIDYAVELTAELLFRFEKPNISPAQIYRSSKNYNKIVNVEANFLNWLKCTDTRSCIEIIHEIVLDYIEQAVTMYGGWQINMRANHNFFVYVTTIKSIIDGEVEQFPSQ